MIILIERLFIYASFVDILAISRPKISLLGSNTVRENINTVLISEV